VRIERKRSLGALKLRSTHVALAVWYKPLADPDFLGCLPYSCNGLRAFPQVPEGEALLNKREREVSLKGQPYLGCGGESFLENRFHQSASHVLRQDFPVWHNLYRPQVKT
jgi:hypothetical protein